MKYCSFCNSLVLCGNKYLQLEFVAYEKGFIWIHKANKMRKMNYKQTQEIQREKAILTR